MGTSPDTIVLIHGLWMTPRSWEHWVARYESSGYRVLAPAWPGLEGKEPAELRADPTPLRQLEIRRIVAHYEEIIRGLDRPPVIVGHSFGGGFMQILIDRGLGAAGVGLSAATVKGIYDLPLSTLRATMAILGNPFSRGGATQLTPKRFRYAFGNTLTEEESNAAWERYAVPAANRVLWQGAFANFAVRPAMKVNWRNPDRAPLLFVGATEDHIIPAKVSRKIARKHGRSPVPVEYKEFAGRSHFLAGQQGWEEIADFALSWATASATATVPESAPDAPPVPTT